MMPLHIVLTIEVYASTQDQWHYLKDSKHILVCSEVFYRLSHNPGCFVGIHFLVFKKSN